MKLLQYNLKENRSVIYCFHCILTGKKYIGRTINERQRINHHLLNYKYEYKSKNKFYSSLKKYGVENFIYGVIEECDISLLNERECYYINLYDTIDNGLNTTSGGESGGNKHNIETREKMSLSRKGKKQTENWIENRIISRKINNKKWSEESREKARQSKLGKPSPKKGKKYTKKKNGN